MQALIIRSSRRLFTRCSHTATSVDPSEIEKFSSLAKEWWHPTGPFAALHCMNGVRVPLVKEVAHVYLKHVTPSNNVQALTGLKILDVGCGGGILSEPLARLGAEVTGVDASSTNIGVAEDHARLDNSLADGLQYRCCTVEDMLHEQEEAKKDGSFDIVIASEVIEHVANQSSFVKTCTQLAKPGGAVMFTTINRTWLSYASAIVAAESVLGLVPPGTHEWRKFVTPEELADMLRGSGSPITITALDGLFYHFLTKHWTKTTCTDINYALVGVKVDTAADDSPPTPEEDNQ